MIEEVRDDGVQVKYRDYIELKYELTYSLKELTGNVSRLSTTVEKKFVEQDEKMETQGKDIQCIKDKLPGTEKGKPSDGVTSLPSNIKWLLVLILGIAFLGALGAAIGINLLEYFNPGGAPA